jgi:hypothetical protein
VAIASLLLGVISLKVYRYLAWSGLRRIMLYVAGENLGSS